MKAFLIFLCMLQPLVGKAQSLIIEDDGDLLTIDRMGALYDVRQSVHPREVIASGKNWFILDSGEINVVSGKGTLNKASFKVTDPRSSGGHWFTAGRDEIYVTTIDGNVVKNKQPLARNSIVAKGANWLVVKKNRSEAVLLTMNTAYGSVVVTEGAALNALNLNLYNMRATGGNWWIDGRGTLFVVTVYGTVLAKRDQGVFLSLIFTAGNFFISSDGATRAVLDNGSVLMPYLPLTYGSLVHSGDTYAWNMSGEFFTFAETIHPAYATNLSDPKILDKVLRGIVQKPIRQPEARLLDVPPRAE